MPENKDIRTFGKTSVRRLRLRDLDRIMDIETASFGDEAYGRKLFAEFFHRCGELFLAVERRRRVCGYLIACVRGNSAELVSIAVAPEERRAGAASALMESLLRRLKRRGIGRLWLTVKAGNRAAACFYEKYGFRRGRLVHGYYEDGSDGWRMSRYAPD